VADAFVAMTSDRPYRRALSVSAAVAELASKAGTQFDPLVVAVLRSELERDPALALTSHID
jgi:polar amino acid transport system substrate-binding protein